MFKVSNTLVARSSHADAQKRAHRPWNLVATTFMPGVPNTNVSANSDTSLASIQVLTAAPCTGGVSIRLLQITTTTCQARMSSWGLKATEVPLNCLIWFLHYSSQEQQQSATLALSLAFSCQHVQPNKYWYFLALPCYIHRKKSRE